MTHRVTDQAEGPSQDISGASITATAKTMAALLAAVAAEAQKKGPGQILLETRAHLRESHAALRRALESLARARVVRGHR